MFKAFNHQTLTANKKSISIVYFLKTNQLILPVATKTIRLRE